MIKLTQQQEFELPLAIPLVALELPLDLLVDPHLLHLLARHAALLHGRPGWLAGEEGLREGHGAAAGTCGSPALCLHSSSCGIQLRGIPAERRRRC